MLMSSAGGLLYHLKALRFARRYWAPHRAGTRVFLESYAGPKTSVTLVGPSGGYSLPKEWIWDWDQVTVVEPDPLARLIFRIRFWGVRDLRFIRCVQEVPAPGQGESHPADLVVFCNFLGQIEGLLDEARESGELAPEKAFGKGLANLLIRRDGEMCSWLSYHDRWSGEITPTSAAILDFPIRASDEKLKEEFFRGANSGELTEHSALEFLPEAARASGAPAPVKQWSYWIWRLTPTAWHLIEATGSAVRALPTQ